MTANPRILILMDTDRTYERGLVKGILRYSCLHGHFQLMRSESQPLGGLHKLGLDKIRQWQPDGICWREGHAIRNIEELGLPSIYFPLTEPNKRYSNVITDDLDIGARVARHLLARGLVNFAFCGLSDEYYWSRGRMEGFQSEIERAEFEVNIFDLLEESSSLENWIKDLPKPIGMMVCTDDCSVEIYSAISKLGLRVPEDVALIGVGNDEIVCEFSTPPLSSVKLNLEEAGFIAAGQLDRMIKGVAENEDIVIETFDVIERPSSNFIAVENELLASALKFIQDHRTKRITVEDVVAALPTSRRQLYRLFKHKLGRSIAEEIRATRMNQAAMMLTNTNFSISEICEHLSFDSPQNFARAFQREKGVTPYKYRAKNTRFNN